MINITNSATHRKGVRDTYVLNVINLWDYQATFCSDAGATKNQQ